MESTGHNAALICVDVFNDLLFATTRKSISAAVNLLALSIPSHPMHVGLCALSIDPTTKSLSLQMKSWLAELNLVTMHTAVSKLIPPTPEAEQVAGETASLAAERMADMLRKYSSHARKKTIVIVTDQIYPVEDFAPYFAAASRTGDVDLSIVVIVEAGRGNEVARAAQGWNIMEAMHPGTKVTISEVAGLSAYQYLGRAVAHMVAPPPTKTVEIRFASVPILGAVRSFHVQACAQVEPLSLVVKPAMVCPCHDAPLATASGQSTCPVTGTSFPSEQGTATGRIIAIGDQSTPAGILHLRVPFALADQPRSSPQQQPTPLANHGTANAFKAAASSPPSPVTTLTVTSRLKLERANAGLLLGPSLLLHAEDAALDSFTLETNVNGGTVHVGSAELLRAVLQGLIASGDALVCHASEDLLLGLGGGSSSSARPEPRFEPSCLAFRRHYILLPASTGPNREANVLCALRVASLEEIAPLPRARAGAGLEKNTSEVVERQIAKAVAAQLAKLRRTEPEEATTYTSKVHETIEMLVKESRPPPEQENRRGRAGDGAAAEGLGVEELGPVSATRERQGGAREIERSLRNRGNAKMEKEDELTAQRRTKQPKQTRGRR